MHPYYLVIQICVLWASQMILTVKILPSNAGDARGMGLICGWGRSPGVGNGNPLQFSCLETPMDRGTTPIFLSGDSHGTWWASVYRVAKSQTWMSTCAHTHIHSVCYIMYTYMQYCLSVLQNEDNFHHTVLIRTILANKMSTTVSSCISLVRTIWNDSTVYEVII